MSRPEVWLSAAGWPGYQVSSRGQVRSVDRIVVDKRGVRRRCKGRVLRLHTSPHGGISVGLSHRGRAKTVNVNTLWRRALESDECRRRGEQRKAG